jgi:predicted secreted hydrolase
MNAKALLIFLLQCTPVLAQGFAGLGTDAGGFAVPQPGRELVFPADHGPHPDYRIEWWYVTANLSGPDGADYGAQWTLFRSALSPQEKSGWSSPQLWMGHAALTTKDHHHVAERISRGGIGQAGVSTAPFSAWIDDWQMTSQSAPGTDELAKLGLGASGTSFSYRLNLNATGPVVAQGQQGYSVKSAKGQASYYYSQPFYQVSGTLKLQDGEVPVSGHAWLDHEWSSQPLAADQTGWDWFSLHFDSGEKLMGFRLRDAGEGYTSATWIGSDGKPEPQPPGVLKVTPMETAEIAGRKLPVRWRVELPGKGLDVTTRVLNKEAWMSTQVAYWEGPVRLEGSHKGRGYVEMTGYK